MAKTKVLQHPIIQEQLLVLRDKNTNQTQFRTGLEKLGKLMGYEIMHEFKTQKKIVETPLGEKAEGITIPDKDNVIIVYVLRAAIPFVHGLLKAFPAARCGVVSAWRKKDLSTEIKYVKMPRIRETDTLIVADPMIATGNSITAVLNEAAKYGVPRRVIVAGVLACEYGINVIFKAHPDIEVFVAGIDKEFRDGFKAPGLNSHGYIVPGLGDCGDRAFGELHNPAA